MLLFVFEDNSMPMEESVIFERRPNISRNQDAQAALRHTLITRPIPKALMVAQARPAAPCLPKTRDSAAAGPTSVVNMANSTNPLPKLGTWKLNADVGGAESDMPVALGFNTCGRGLGKSGGLSMMTAPSRWMNIWMNSHCREIRSASVKCQCLHHWEKWDLQATEGIKNL
jgi:hypothetical protein